MTKHPSSAGLPAVTPATQQHPLADRVAACELFLQHLVFTLDATGALRADALDEWLSTARFHMGRTGSVKPTQVAALAALQQDVFR